MVNAVNLISKESVGGAAACLFFGNFGLETDDLGLQSLNPLFQFGHGNRIKIFADNHVGWLFRFVIEVHGIGSLCCPAILPLRRRVLQPIVGQSGVRA